MYESSVWGLHGLLAYSNHVKGGNSILYSSTNADYLTLPDQHTHLSCPISRNDTCYAQLPITDFALIDRLLDYG